MSTSKTEKLMIADMPETASVAHVIAMRLKRLLDADMVKTLDGAKVTDWRILLALVRHAPMSQTAIARWIVMEQAQTSRALKAMQESGLVLASRDKEDGRRQTYTITPKGLAEFKRVEPMMFERRHRIDSALTATELQQFADLASRVARQTTGELDLADYGIHQTEKD